MAITPKVLAEGQLPASKTTLYTVPGATSAYVRFISANNVGGAEEVVQFYVKPGGTSRRLGRYALLANEVARVLEQGEVITLEAGDIIEGETTNATSVDYLITGAEEA